MNKMTPQGEATMIAAALFLMFTVSITGAFIVGRWDALSSVGRGYCGEQDYTITSSGRVECSTIFPVGLK